MNLNSLTLRSATSEDVEFLTRTFLTSLRESIEAARGRWSESRERAQFVAQLDLDHTKIICVRSREVGFLTAILRAHEIEIHTLCVVPDQQGQGIGSQVTRQVIQSAHAAGYAVALSVLKTNQRAAKLYRRLGFEQVDELEHHLRFRRAQDAVSHDG